MMRTKKSVYILLRSTRIKSRSGRLSRVTNTNMSNVDNTSSLVSRYSFKKKELFFRSSTSFVSEVSSIRVQERFHCVRATDSYDAEHAEDLPRMRREGGTQVSTVDRTRFDVSKRWERNNSSLIRTQKYTW